MQAIKAKDWTHVIIKSKANKGNQDGNGSFELIAKIITIFLNTFFYCNKKGHIRTNCKKKAQEI
jgi:hypothetical protein